MKTKRVALAILATSMTLCSVTKGSFLPKLEQAGAENTNVIGTWAIEGTNDQYGAYRGTLKVQAQTDDSLVAYRDVQLLSYSYKGQAIEEVWEGSATFNNNQLELRFIVNPTGFIREVDDYKVDSSKSPLYLRAQIKTDAATGLAQLSWPEAHESDQVQFGSANISGPTKVTDVTTEVATRPLGQLTRDILEFLVGRYYKDPFVDSFKDRPEYESGTHFIVFDKTNFDFYRNNKNQLRVVNRVLDPAGFEEQRLRASAYGPTLAEKAKAYDEAVVRDSLDEFGLVSFANVDSNGKVINHSPDYSTALWTGQYILSQAYRLQETGDQQALSNIKRALKGLVLLMQIDPVTSEFARSVHRFDPNAPMAGWRQGEGAFKGLEYSPLGNNDMSFGFLTGFLFGYEALPDSEVELKQAIQAQIRRFADQSKLAQTKTGTKALSAGVAYLITGDQKYQERYRKTIDSLKYTILSDTPIPKQIGGIADWSGNNLTAVNEILRTHVSLRMGANHDHEEILNLSYHDWKQLAPFRVAPHTFFLKGEETPEHPIADQRVQEAIWCLKEFPIEKPREHLRYDLSLNKSFVLSPYPSLPWKYIFDQKRPTSDGYQSISSYPLFETVALDSNWVWRSTPLGYSGGTEANQIISGADYLFAYWLARHAKVITAND